MSPSVIRVIGRRVTVRLGKCIIESIPIWAYHNLILRTECALNDKAYFSYIKYMAGDGADRLAATGRRRCFFFLYNNRLFFPNKWLKDRERLYCAVLSAEKEIKMTTKVNTTTKTNTSRRTRYMVELALMIAIIFIMAFTPLGYLKTPGLSITFLTVPVAVGAMILGPKGGAICGFAFGITSLIQCFGNSAFGAMLLGISPFGTAFTCIVPRVLEGLLCGLIFKAVRAKKTNLAYAVGGFSCPVLNTILYMSSLVLFFYNTDYIQGFVEALGVSNPLTFVVAFVGLQGAIEAVVCTVVAAAVARALAAALKTV